VTLGLCNITAKLPNEGLCSWPPTGPRPRLKNPGLGLTFRFTVLHRVARTIR